MTSEETAVDTQAKPEGHAVARWEESGVPAETVGFARAMVASGYFKGVTSVAQAIVKIEMGKELGVTPVEAMQYLHIFVVGEGTAHERTSIQLGYPLVGALIQRSGKYHFDVRAKTEDACEIDFYRILEGGATKKIGTSRFTMEKAQRAGLLGRNASLWKAWPDTMLYARALTHGARTFCPEILGGAGVAADTAYIEGAARIIDEDSAEPPTIEEPPEGFAPPWARFWAFVKEPRPAGLGLDEDEVHRFFGVDSLKASADRIVENSGKTEAEVVAEFEATIREAYQKSSRECTCGVGNAADAELHRTGCPRAPTAQKLPEPEGE